MTDTQPFKQRIETARKVMEARKRLQDQEDIEQKLAPLIQRYTAATRASQSILERGFSRGLPKRTRRVDVAPSEDIEIILLAALFRVTGCPHIKAETPTPSFALLDARKQYCQPCLKKARPIPNNGKCDVCDEPSDRFTPFAVGFYSITIVGNACNRCFEILMGKQKLDV